MGLRKAETGAVSVVQRCGGSLNLHVHVQAIHLDGVYTRDERTGRARFHFVQAPTREDIAAVARQVCERAWSVARAAPSRPSTKASACTPG
jgi:hypothetical protein